MVKPVSLHASKLPAWIKRFDAISLFGLTPAELD
jgi:hypothetical protein